MRGNDFYVITLQLVQSCFSNSFREILRVGQNGSNDKAKLCLFTIKCSTYAKSEALS